MKKHKLMTFLLDLWDYSTENGKEVLPPKVVLRSKIPEQEKVCGVLGQSPKVLKEVKIWRF